MKDVTAYKLTAALLAGCFSGLVVILGKTLTGNAWAGLLGGLWTLASPSMAYFAASFPKNLMGMDFLLLVLLFDARRKTLPALLSLILAALTHRLTAALSFLFLLFRRLSLRNALLLACFAALGLGLSTFLPGLARFSDLARFEGAFSPTPHFPHQAFTELMGGSELPLIWRLEFWMGLVLFLGLAILFFLRRLPESLRPWYGSLLLLLLLLNFPFLKMDALGMGYRFFLAGALFIPLALIPIAWCFPLSRFLLFPLFLAAAFWTQSSFSTLPYGPSHADNAHVADRIAAHFENDPPELLIGHKGMAEHVTFATGIDVLPWLPEYEVDSMELWRISTGIFSMDFRTYLSRDEQEEVVELSVYCALLRESLWRRLVARAEAADDEELLERINDWQNPHEMRPGYLLEK